MTSNLAIAAGKTGSVALVLWFTGVGLAAAEHRPIAGGWGPATAEVGINTGFGEGCPHESPDGLSLFIASTRDGDGILDIWAADRVSIGSPWSDPRRLDAPVNLDLNDFCPSPSGRSLLFVSERADGSECGGGDIYHSRQSPAGGWSEPVNLGCAPTGPNTPGPERSPSVVETWFGTFLFYSTNVGAGDHDIYVSRLGPDGRFGPGQAVRGLNSEADDFMPNVRQRERGGLEIVFNSNRPTWGRKGADAFGGQDVYTSVGIWPLGPWSMPVNLGPNVNTAGAETRATISGDGSRLHFGRDGDIFVSER